MTNREEFMFTMNHALRSMSDGIAPIGTIARMLVEKNPVQYTYRDILEVLGMMEIKIVGYTETPENLEVLEKFVEVIHTAILMMAAEIYPNHGSQYYSELMYKIAAKFAIGGGSWEIDFTTLDDDTDV